MSSKITILDATMTELATLNAVSSALRLEKINSDNTLTFSFPIRKVESAYIESDTVYELDGDYFDTAYYKKEQQSDGRLMVSIEAEHVSYRLNNAAYNLEFFTETGSPAYILGKIIEGTELTVGTVDFSTNMSFSLQEATSRRSLLMQFAAYLGGELEFDGFTISLLAQRGSSIPKALTVGKDVTVISKAVDKRTLDEDGNPTIAYTCGVYKGASLNLGDVVSLDYEALDIDVSLRVVAKSHDPYNPNNVMVEIGNYVNALEDDLYRIETQTVSKDALMNGVRIGPEYGFEAVRNDKKARAFFRSDGLAIQTGDGSGEAWTNKMWVEIDGEGKARLMFDGELSVGVVNALSAVITPNLYAGKATIAEVTVDQADTSDKVQKYLDTDKTDDNFQRLFGQYHDFITAQTDGTANEHVTNRHGDPLYWTDDTFTAASEAETEWPVLSYIYTEQRKMRVGFMLDPSGSGYQIPVIELGVGTGTDNHAKGYIYKGVTGLYIDYYSSTDGSLRRIILGDDGIILTPYALESLDFYANGFRAVYSGETVAMTYEKDGGGRITKLITEDMEVIPVGWHAGDM